MNSINLKHTTHTRTLPAQYTDPTSAVRILHGKIYVFLVIHPLPPTNTHCPPIRCDDLAKPSEIVRKHNTGRINFHLTLCTSSPLGQMEEESGNPMRTIEAYSRKCCYRIILSGSVVHVGRDLGSCGWLGRRRQQPRW